MDEPERTPPLAGDAESLFELFAPAAAQTQFHAALQAHAVVATRLAQHRIDAIESDDGGAMNAKENIGVETLFEGLHTLADGVRPVADVKLPIRTAGGDVVDLLD